MRSRDRRRFPARRKGEGCHANLADGTRDRLCCKERREVVHHTSTPENQQRNEGHLGSRAIATTSAWRWYFLSGPSQTKFWRRTSEFQSPSVRVIIFIARAFFAHHMSCFTNSRANVEQFKQHASSQWSEGSLVTTAAILASSMQPKLPAAAARCCMQRNHCGWRRCILTVNKTNCRRCHAQHMAIGKQRHLKASNTGQEKSLHFVRGSTADTLS